MSQSEYTDSMATGFAGRVDYAYRRREFITMRNDEAADEIAFGVAVKYDDAANDRTSAAKLDAIADIVPGIFAHSHEYESTQLGDTGLKPDQTMNVLRAGRIQVVCVDGCKPGDRLHIAAVGGSGGLRASADGVNTIDATGQGYWDSVAAAGELAWLIVDFTAQKA